MTNVPDKIEKTRRTLCEQAGCEFLDKLDYSDACIECPNGHWGIYFCSAEVKPSYEWPTVLKPMKLLAIPTDKGLGDIVERVIGPIGGSAYRIWHQAIFGRPCSCAKRQDRLNQRFPLVAKVGNQ